MTVPRADPGPHSLILHSPYLLGPVTLDRADLPHHFATPGSGERHRTLDTAIAQAGRPDVLARVR
ncbi:hypothetical protein ACGFMK_19960 [Amycolatopsis sp. NPDC049252]|uniref:hypothetical protein n=1 Tax=Amycolatopsis sp. NPDC049252 TaxID=3363933 RepID=UPI003711B455